MAETTDLATGTVDHRALQERLAALFAFVGVPDGQAAGIAEVLVQADLRGMESHGVRFAPRYLRGFSRGFVNARPQLEFVAGKGSTALLDADNGLGLVSARRAMELAEDHGVGVVVVWLSGVAASPWFPTTPSPGPFRPTLRPRS